MVLYWYYLIGEKMTEFMENLLHEGNWIRKRGGPLYIQLREHIETAINSGSIKPGDALPSEREIAEMSSISRITVRKAVQELVRDGLIVQKQGSGTSVAPIIERVQQSLSKLTSFSEDMTRRGKIVKSIFLEKGIFRPSPQETLALGLKPDILVSRISRLRIVDNIPLAIERASLSQEYLADPQKVGHSLYAYLAELKCKPNRAIQRISAINLNKTDAKILEVEAGVAGLNIERTSYLATGQVVEFTQSIYRGDAYDFIADLQIAEHD
jgi:GntR family transcriptional regulator